MGCNVPFRKKKIDTYMSTPQPGEIHWIQCKGYRCLGVLDAHGKWKCFATGEELKDVVNPKISLKEVATVISAQCLLG